MSVRFPSSNLLEGTLGAGPRGTLLLHLGVYVRLLRGHRPYSHHSHTPPSGYFASSGAHRVYGLVDVTATSEITTVVADKMMGRTGQAIYTAGASLCCRRALTHFPPYLGIFLILSESQPKPSVKPSPSVAMAGWTNHNFSLSLVSSSLSVITWGFMAVEENRETS